MARTAAYLFLSMLIPAVLAGCASGRETAASLGAEHNLVAQVLDGGHFDLYVLRPRSFTPGQPLTVYIEGDGFAYIDRWRLSDDPTPRDPVGLELAVRDPAPNVVYVARPCQYVTGGNRRNCRPVYWSVGRYSDQVVGATSAVIDQVLRQSGAPGLRLVGHSGGGVVALLVAARRDDVAHVLTVASPLDTDSWTRADDLAPLIYSRNPADAADRLARVPQLHLAGQDDRVVPPAIVQAYANRFPRDSRPTVRVVAGQDHSCCWAEHWREFSRMAR